MKERPIPFNGAMVRALLAGTKTQTRRAAKGVATVHARTGEPLAKLDSAGPRVACPYGQPGDRLWVREAWRADQWFDGRPPREIPDAAYVVYEAGGQHVPFPAAVGKLRPGMFMPRWASRITLEVTGVRVERLQDISEADAKAEGMTPALAGELLSEGECRVLAWAAANGNSARMTYSALWEQINGPGSWDANPWVWVVEFQRTAVGSQEM